MQIVKANLNVLLSAGGEKDKIHIALNFYDKKNNYTAQMMVY